MNGGFRTCSTFNGEASHLMDEGPFMKKNIDDDIR